MNVSLVLLKKDGSTKAFTLPSTVTSIGRRQDCDFCLPLSMVSRKHCEISLNADHVSIRDLASRNGTFLNGQRIEETRAKAGDILQVGPVSFVIQVDGVPVNFDRYREQAAQQADKAAESNGAETLTNHRPPNSETTEILDSLPDDFDVESDAGNELNKR